MNYDYIGVIENHYKDFWGQEPDSLFWQKGRVHELPQGFKVLRFKPTTKRNMWTYATCGMSISTDKEPIELHVFTPTKKDKEIAELLTVIAHYHRTGAFLNLGHTVNFGNPWIVNSKCNYGLLSLPYLDGGSLEWLDLGEQKVRFLWLVPITQQEAEYKKKYGLEALEEEFDKVDFNYLNPERESVV